MRKIPVKQLKTGMVIGRTVCAGDGKALFAPGTIIDESKVNQLINLGIKSIDVDDADHVRKYKEITRKEITGTVRSIFRDLTLTCQVDQGVIQRTVNKILRRVIKNRCVMMHITEVRGLDSYVFSHSVNVCMLSLILGLFLKLKKEDLKNLGLAALLHDVGRTGIPRDILYKTCPLEIEEFEKVKNHTVLGHEILSSCNQFPDIIAQTALQHHERLDGSGYPAGKAGREIGLFPRIVAICDVFDALLANRPFRKAFFPHQAVEIIVNSTGQFDREILDVFLENVVIYPLGTMVSLSSGEMGVVVDMNKGHQTRPVVRVMYGTDLNKLHNMKEIDLSKSSDIFITGILNGEQTEGTTG